MQSLQLCSFKFEWFWHSFWLWIFIKMRKCCIAMIFKWKSLSKGRIRGICDRGSSIKLGIKSSSLYTKNVVIITKIRLECWFLILLLLLNILFHVTQGFNLIARFEFIDVFLWIWFGWLNSSPSGIHHCVSFWYRFRSRSLNSHLFLNPVKVSLSSDKIWLLLPFTFIKTIVKFIFCST